MTWFSVQALGGSGLTPCMVLGLTPCMVLIVGMVGALVGDEPSASSHPLIIATIVKLIDTGSHLRRTSQPTGSGRTFGVLNQKPTNKREIWFRLRVGTA